MITNIEQYEKAQAELRDLRSGFDVYSTPILLERKGLQRRGFGR